MRRQEITKFLDVDYQPQPFICMYPSCENKPVRTHSVSRAWLQMISDERNCVVAPRPRYDAYFESDDSNFNERPIKSKLVAYNTKRLSTCYCFCALHDGSIFQKIDKFQAFQMNRTSAFLLAYRSICHEICVKRKIRSMLADVSVPADDADLLAFIESRHNFGLESISQIHESMQSAIVRGNFRGTRHFAIVIDALPDILCSGFFAPVDEENVTRQIRRASYLNAINVNDQLALTIMPYQNNKGIIVLSWYGKSRRNKEYIDLLKGMRESQLLNCLFVSVFQYMENYYLRPAFWDSLAADKQELLLKRFESDINPQMLDSYQSVRSNTTNYVNWSVVETMHNVR